MIVPHSAGEGFGGQGHGEFQQPPSEQESHGARQQAKQSAFRQQLADKARPARPKRQARLQFILARSPASQLQAANIGASHPEQHRGSEHNEQNGQFQPRVEFQGEGERGTRQDEYSSGFRRLGARLVQGAEAIGQKIHLRLRAGDADTRRPSGQTSGRTGIHG